MSGEREIHPARPGRHADDPRRQGQGHRHLQICIADSGAVSSIKQLRSTGYPAYDRRLESGMSAWRYRPLLIDNKAVAACGSVTFIYEIH